MKKHLIIFILVSLSSVAFGKNPYSIKLEKLNSDSSQFVKLKLTIINHSIWRQSFVDIFSCSSCYYSSDFYSGWVVHVKNIDREQRLIFDEEMGFPAFFEVASFSSESKIFNLNLSKSVVIEEGVDITDRDGFRSKNWRKYWDENKIKDVSPNDTIRRGHYSISISQIFKENKGQNYYIDSDTIYHNFVYLDNR
jgi:hypothetical protein